MVLGGAGLGVVFWGGLMAYVYRKLSDTNQGNEMVKNSYSRINQRTKPIPIPKTENEYQADCSFEDTLIINNPPLSCSLAPEILDEFPFQPDPDDEQLRNSI